LNCKKNNYFGIIIF